MQTVLAMFTLRLVDHEKMPVVSCVYSIRHTVSGREYIGRTNNLRQRMRKHYQELFSGTHSNPKMLRTYIKYGDYFVVQPLLIGSPEYCESVEAKLLAGIPNLKDSLNCHRNSIGGWLGQDWSEESRKKLSAARKGKPISKEAQARAVETRKTSSAWAAHQEKMKQPEMVAKAVAAAAKPEVRQKAVETRRKNGHKPFRDEVRQRQKDEAKARVFAALDWAVANNGTRDAALKMFSCSWDGLKKYQPEWEAINGPLTIPKRASGERNGSFKHGLSKERRRKKTSDEIAEVNRRRSLRMSGDNNPMFGRKHTEAAREIQSAAAKRQAMQKKGLL